MKIVDMEIQGEAAPGPAPRQVPGMGSSASCYL